MRNLAAGVLLAMASVNCAAQTQTPAAVSKQVEERTGHGISLATKAPGFTVPDGVSLDDGVSEDEAVAIALWNNPALQAEMTALGIARADLIQAGQLTNPSLTLIIPFSARIVESVANWPFEALWQRPRRVAAAKLELDRVGESLIPRALDLVRDVRLGYADYALAQARARVAEQAMRERAEIVTIVNARFRAGDISELETGTARLDARLAEEQAVRLTQEVILAQGRLGALLGIAGEGQIFRINAPSASEANQPANVNIVAAAFSTPSAATPKQTLSELTKQALEARPELKAGEFAIEAAGARAKWERSRILAVSAIVKEYGRGANGFEQGPGVQIELPIFNRNQGGISRAEAEIERAAKQLIAARQRVVAEVQEAYTQLAQAREAHEVWRTRVLPAIEQDIRLAERAYSAGDVAYLFVLENMRRLTDARLREPELQAATARALALLERSVGRRLFANR